MTHAPEERETGIKFRLTPIANGTVLDHLPVGTASKIVQLLGLDTRSGTVTMAMHTESRQCNGYKDLLFIENKELTALDLDKIGLIACGSTWNTILNRQVIKKQKIVLPNRVKNVIKCPNPRCITNAEPIPTRFHILDNPLEAVCFYCERTIPKKDILKSFK